MNKITKLLKENYLFQFGLSFILYILLSFSPYMIWQYAAIIMMSIMTWRTLIHYAYLFKTKKNLTWGQLLIKVYIFACIVTGMTLVIMLILRFVYGVKVF